MQTKIRQSWKSEFGSWTKIFDARSDITNLWKYMMLYIAVWIGVNGTVSPPYDDINTCQLRQSHPERLTAPLIIAVAIGGKKGKKKIQSASEER